MRNFYNCDENRPGFACVWAIKDGSCSALGGCSEIVDACKGCGRIVFYKEKPYCEATIWPEHKWDRGKTCLLATHVKRVVEANDKKKTNPIKASKRSAKKTS